VVTSSCENLPQNEGVYHANLIKTTNSFYPRQNDLDNPVLLQQQDLKQNDGKFYLTSKNKQAGVLPKQMMEGGLHDKLLPPFKTVTKRKKIIGNKLKEAAENYMVNLGSITSLNDSHSMPKYNHN
jgi:hypothetical protein